MQLEVDRLVYCYPSGVRALDGVTLQVPAGSRVALLGANGAGKSTLARHWNGLLHPTEGTVRVGGVDLRELRPPQVAARVAYLFQNPDDQLLGRPLREEVAFGPRLLGVRDIEARVDRALAALDLAGDRRHPFDLDYGGRKLLALACVLAMETPVLILDEPTANLDDSAVRRVTMALAQRPNTTIVAITHDVDWAAETFDRILVMGNGRVVADGPGSEVLNCSWPGVELPSIPFLAQGLDMPSATVRYASFVEAYSRRGAEHTD